MKLRWHLALLSLVMFGGTSYGVQEFGYDGRNGNNGQNGRNGTSGLSVTVQLNGQGESFDLSGSDARDGQRGEHGEDASSCYQPTPAENVNGAEGGDGGTGGQGGRGGNGGDVTVYTDAISNLSQLFVVSRGGEGGRGGDGGWGGDGCRCTYRQWTEQVCRDVQQPDGTWQRECHDETFYCQDGSDGRDGSWGSSGSDGAKGSLTLIPRLEPLEQVTPHVTATLAEFEAEDKAISAHVWSSQSGARQLLRPGSVIADSYSQWEKRIDGSGGIVWNATRDSEPFADSSFNFYFSNEKPVIRPNNNHWLFAESSWDDQRIEYRIDNAITQEEVNSVGLTDTSSYGSGLVLHVSDGSGHQDLLNTKFHMIYAVRWGLIYFQKFHDDIPDELVTPNGDGYDIAIGQLPIASRALNSGRDIRVTMTVTRTAGEYRSNFTKEEYFTIND